MSEYGAQIFLNDSGYDVVNSFLPSYVMDILTVGSNGTKSYDIPPGKSLSAEIFLRNRFSRGNQPSYLINGNVIAWSNLNSQYASIVVYAD